MSVQIPQNIENILNNNFNKATNEDYWHYFAKTNIKPKVRTAALNQKLNDLVNKLGVDSLESKRGPNQWTPLHIAVIKNNLGFIEYLLEKKVSVLEKDMDGHTPVWYANRYCKVMKDVLQDSLMQQELGRAGFLSIPPTPGPFCYRVNTNDFGAEVKRLAIPNLDVAEEESPLEEEKAMRKLERSLESNKALAEKQGIDVNLMNFLQGDQVKYIDTQLRKKRKTEHIVQNFHHLSQILGFDLMPCEISFYPRDFCITQPDGSSAHPSISPHIPKALARVASLEITQEKYTAASLSSHETIIGFKPGVVFDNAHITQLEIQTFFPGKPLTLIPYYMEGGNYFLASTPQGNLKLLISEMGRDIVHNQFRIEKKFSPQKIKSRADEIAPTLNPEQIIEIADQMHAQGLFQENSLIPMEKRIDCLFLAVKLRITNRIQSYREQLIKEEIYEPLDIKRNDVNRYRSNVANYLAQKEEAVALIAESFGMQASDVVVVPQLDYHLDVFMRPGPKGSLFLQSYAKSKKLAQTILNDSNDLSLSKIDVDMLHRYIHSAHTNERELKPVFDRTVAVLESAGFNIHLIPGIFYDMTPSSIQQRYPGSRPYNLNFINSITGFSTKTNRYYYITAGAKVGEQEGNSKNKLGKILMSSFEKIIKLTEKKLDVFFMGYDPNNPSDFSEISTWMNVGGNFAGPHCFSKELEVLEHHELEADEQKE